MTRSSMTRGALDRREFVKLSGFAAGAGAGLVLGTGSAAGFFPARSAGRIKVGVIGCGGRGTGAAVNCLDASPDVEVIALADAFKDRLDGSRAELMNQDGLKDRVKIADAHCFVGFDAYKQLLASAPVDLVILATPPGFRPIHFAAAVEAGKHVFMEKPVAVCPAGVRMVIDAAKRAKDKNLSVVAGTQRRHEKSYIETMKRLEDGAIGTIVAARCFWNQGGLWMNRRKPEWSDTEWQLRNWLYFTWLSGDHICEQHVHNLDVMNWGLDATPVKCTAMGGRQVRTSPDYGHIFDHFSVDFEYAGREGQRGGAPIFGLSTCRQIEGCASGVFEQFTGTEGSCSVWPGGGEIKSAKAGASWKFEGGEPDPYTDEHRFLIDSIVNSKAHNDGVRIAQSTLTAIMGRMSAYTGKAVTWDQAMNSKLSLLPSESLQLGPMETPAVAMPGKTALV